MSNILSIQVFPFTVLTMNLCAYVPVQNPAGEACVCVCAGAHLDVINLNMLDISILAWESWINVSIYASDCCKHHIFSSSGKQPKFYSASSSEYARPGCRVDGTQILSSY